MQLLKNISIRIMVLIIVSFLLVTWGLASGYSFYSLQQATQRLNQSEVQKKSYANVVVGVEQSLQVVATLEKAASQMQNDQFEQAKQALAQVQSVIANARSALVIGVLALLFTEYYLRNYLVVPISVLKSHLAQLTAGRLIP